MKKSIVLIALVGCITPEAGIDRTLLEGKVTIPMSIESDPGDGQASIRDSVADAYDMGPLSWRYTTITGKARSFGDWNSFEASWEGDLDFFAFTGAAEEEVTFSFTYDAANSTETSTGTDTGTTTTSTTDTATGDTGDTGDTGIVEEEPPALLWDVQLYSLDQGLDESTGVPLNSVAGGTSLGAGGLIEFTATIEPGQDYVVGIIPLANNIEADNNYSLMISGHSPEKTSIFAGAYAPFDDMMNRGAPIGGSAVEGWSLDEETKEWSGSYRMTYIRQVEMVEPEVVPEGEEAQSAAVVTEGAQSVMIIAGDFANLNQGLPAGTLYSPTPAEVTMNGPLSGGEEICEETPEDTTSDPGLNLLHCRVVAPDIAVTEIAPKVLGWEITEVEPNDVSVDPYIVDIEVEALANAQDLGVAGSGVGYVDRIVGTLGFPSEEPGWLDGDSDAFGFTVNEPIDATITLDWAVANDFDINLYRHDEANGVVETIGYSWYSQPEVWNVSDYGEILEPGYTYYLVVLAWTGEVGDHPYTIELEWLGL